MSRCATCHAGIAEGEAPATCPDCRQEYHSACWTELGGCATYGCARAVQGSKPAPAQAVAAGWGDSKQCPSCNLTLHPAALECRCGAAFPHADPMTKEEYRIVARRRTRLRATRQALAAMFAFSLLGLPAPVLGPVAGYLAHANRKELAGADGTYLALGYGTAAIGAVYAIVAILLLLGL